MVAAARLVTMGLQLLAEQLRLVVVMGHPVLVQQALPEPQIQGAVAVAQTETAVLLAALAARVSSSFATSAHKKAQAAP